MRKIACLASLLALATGVASAFDTLEVSGEVSFKTNLWSSFADTSLWSLNTGTNNAAPSFSTDGNGQPVLTVIPNVGMASSCAFYKQRIGVLRPWALSFTYEPITESSVCPGDVLAVVLQDVSDTAGVTTNRTLFHGYTTNCILFCLGFTTTNWSDNSYYSYAHWKKNGADYTDRVNITQSHGLNLKNGYDLAMWYTGTNFIVTVTQGSLCYTNTLTYNLSSVFTVTNGVYVGFAAVSGSWTARQKVGDFRMGELLGADLGMSRIKVTEKGTAIFAAPDAEKMQALDVALEGGLLDFDTSLANVDAALSFDDRTAWSLNTGTNGFTPSFSTSDGSLTMIGWTSQTSGSAFHKQPVKADEPWWLSFSKAKKSNSAFDGSGFAFLMQDYGPTGVVNYKSDTVSLPLNIGCKSIGFSITYEYVSTTKYGGSYAYLPFFIWLKNGATSGSRIALEPLGFTYTNAFDITAAYDGSKLISTLKDGSAKFTSTNQVDLASLFGGNHESVYVGFTGANGGMPKPIVVNKFFFAEGAKPSSAAELRARAVIVDKAGSLRVVCTTNTVDSVTLGTNAVLSLSHKIPLLNYWVCVNTVKVDSAGATISVTEGGDKATLALDTVDVTKSGFLNLTGSKVCAKSGAITFVLPKNLPYPYPVLVLGSAAEWVGGVPPAFSLVNESGDELAYRVYYDPVSRSVVVKSTQGAVMTLL